MSQGALCGITENGNIKCWGRMKDTPKPEGPFAAYVNGLAHDCALKASGDVICWGSTRAGQAFPPGSTFTEAGPVEQRIAKQPTAAPPLTPRPTSPRPTPRRIATATSTSPTQLVAVEESTRDTRIAQTYSVDTGSAITLPAGWHLTVETEACSAFEETSSLMNAVICAEATQFGYTTSKTSIQLFAESRKRETAAAYERADIAFYELLSHDWIDIEERHYNRLHYSLRVTEENCLEDRIMILHLFEKANQLHTATVRVGICTPTSDSTEATRTAIFESFMP